MRLGIVLTDDAHVTVACVLMQEALKRGWQIRCFLTHRGVLALCDSDFSHLSEHGAVNMALCEHSFELFSGTMAPAIDVPQSVIIGGQYQDAELVRNSDRVLVF